MSARTIAVVTGTRAEFGLLRPVLRAIAGHRHLKLEVLVTGTHRLGPSRTIDEVAGEFPIAATIPMQSPAHTGRLADAEALGRGISGFAERFAHHQPDVVLVLGDRIEAFAAAAAASVAGIRVAHMHGGDRAQGVADEALRHAITKLAHIHLPATSCSAQRLIAMGEDPQSIHVVGSPAIDDLSEYAPLPDSGYAELGRPAIIVLLHPVGDDQGAEHDRAARLLEIAQRAGSTLALHPNHDDGREGIMRAIESSGCTNYAHLPRRTFVSLLRRVKVLLGNSSAGLIEASAIPIHCINVGRRQTGREMPAHVIDVPDWDYQTIASGLSQCLASPRLINGARHPYGDGRTGLRTAEILANLDFNAVSLSKQNQY